MKNFAVIGAGTMGSGIAQKIALEGGRVMVVDTGQQALDRARSLMDSIFSESLARRILSPGQVEEARARLVFADDLQAVKGSDLVIEAVFEDKAVKRELFSQLESIVSPDTVLATNTSSFQVGDLSRDLRHKERFIGLHFFYHPVKNRLLEIIPGEKTAPGTLAAARQFCRLLGKVDIVCKDSPGFVVNRFFVPWLNEAVRLLAEGTYSLEEIEAAARQGFALDIGPFELMNLTGLPIARHAASSLAGALGDFYRPHDRLLEQAAKGPWEIDLDKVKAISNPHPEIFRRLFGVVLVIGAGLAAEGTAGPLAIDLSARIGLRWPKGPFILYNQMPARERRAVLDAFAHSQPHFPVPADILITPFHLPLVAQELETLAGQPVKSLILSRPDRANALNETVFSELEMIVREDRGLSPFVIIRGQGKNFCAGADVDFFIENIEGGRIDRIVDFTRRARQTIDAIDRFPGRVIALADGFALGGGAELMLAADVIVSTPRALIGFPETGIGIYPGLSGAFRLTQRLGKGLSRYLIGTGRLLNGLEAEAIGLVDACLPPQEIASARLISLSPRRSVERVAQWLEIPAFMAGNSLEQLLAGTFTEPWQVKIQEKLKSKAPIALEMAFRLIDLAGTADFAAFQELELDLLPVVFRTEDALTGLKSIGKSRPVFKGK